MRNLTPNRRNRFGLASVDMIVGLACLMLLTSLALPYLLSLRSTMRSQECMNRMRVLVFALAQYRWTPDFRLRS